EFGHTYYYAGNKIDANIHSVVRQVIIPFARDYKAFVMANGDMSSHLSLVTSNREFVVHGHDVGAREAVPRVLQIVALQAVIRQEQPNSGRTIIEKFEESAAAVSFAVILLTPDDFVRSAGSDQIERARQNVIYELGYFAGKLGRGRVCLLRK